MLQVSVTANLAANQAKPRRQFNFGPRQIGKYAQQRYNATLLRKPRDSSLGRLVKTRISLMTEQ